MFVRCVQMVRGDFCQFFTFRSVTELVRPCSGHGGGFNGSRRAPFSTSVWSINKDPRTGHSCRVLWLLSPPCSPAPLPGTPPFPSPEDCCQAGLQSLFCTHQPTLLPVTAMHHPLGKGPWTCSPPWL